MMISKIRPNQRPGLNDTALPSGKHRLLLKNLRESVLIRNFNKKISYEAKKSLPAGKLF